MPDRDDYDFQVNAESLKQIAPMFGNMLIHGDSFNKHCGLWEWDLEFCNVRHAANFAAVFENDFFEIDFRLEKEEDEIRTLNQSVVLIAVEKEPRK